MSNERWFVMRVLLPEDDTIIEDELSDALSAAEDAANEHPMLGDGPKFKIGPEIVSYREPDVIPSGPAPNEINVVETCPTCAGTGGGQYNDCETCGGNGVW